MSDRVEGDFYLEEGFMVFTKEYHLKRGYCCGSGCRHCPYKSKDGLRPRVSVSWSGGKDSAYALHHVLMSGKFDVIHLHTIIDEETRRVGLHGVSEELIDKQAAAIGIPLKKIYLKAFADGDVYRECLAGFYHQCVEERIDGVVFGDIFLEDLRAFRQKLLEPFSLFGLFPLWKRNSNHLLSSFIEAGFKTTICSADASIFSREELGRIIDERFVASLPKGIDPNGENGEFHTFVCDGPIFKRPVPLTKGDVIKRAYSYKVNDEHGREVERKSEFWFQDFKL
jgi:uncharacterized protein (TIGR00290 family)